MKIDITKIEGYDTMTPEQRLAALENFEIDEPDNKGHVRKEVFDKTASELAALKRQLKERMTAEEIKAQEEAAKREELENNYNTLLKQVNVSNNKAKLLGLGYDETLAGETAEAMVNGELDKVFANQKKHLEFLEKKIRADVLKDTPKPTGDPTTTGVDYQKKIEEATRNGDISAAAYYTRLAATAEQTT